MAKLTKAQFEERELLIDALRLWSEAVYAVPGMPSRIRIEPDAVRRAYSMTKPLGGLKPSSVAERMRRHYPYVSEYAFKAEIKRLKNEVTFLKARARTPEPDLLDALRADNEALQRRIEDLEERLRCVRPYDLETLEGMARASRERKANEAA